MTKEMGFDRKRTFGVEIEFVGNAHKVQRACAELGMDVRIESYNHVTKRHWKIVTDASVRGNGQGLEIVSPILKGDNGLEQIKTICKALSKAGATVNRTCGLHVHHGAADLDVTAFKNLYILYRRFEKTIDEMMPNSRRGQNNTYCRSVNSYHAPTESEVMAASTVSQFVDCFETRFLKLNFQSFRSHTTIEFRHHSGTMEADKIINWIKFSQVMLNKSTDGEVYKTKAGADNWKLFKEVIYALKFKGATEEIQAVTNFYNKRRKQLARAS